MDIVIGIDIGGHLVRVGAFDLGGELLATRQAPIEASRGPRFGLERISELIQSTTQEVSAAGEAVEPNLLGIGIGCTGPVYPRTGVVDNPYTLPTWEKVPLGPWLEERFNLPVRLENDADAAALGEYWHGAGVGVSRLYAVTVGTGIGTALIVDGEIYRGLDGAHPEGGHQVIDPNGPLCYCGSHGCWESLTAGPAIERLARHALADPYSLTGRVTKELSDEDVAAMRGSQLHGVDEAALDGKLVARLALQGDLLATKVIESAARYLSLGIVNIVMLFAPEMIVLGGGVMENHPLFIPAIQKTIQELSPIVPADKVQIHLAKLGALAGMYGGAYSIVQRL